MRRFELVARRKLEFNACAAVPVPVEDEVLVQVKACTICGRSDLTYYHYLGEREHCDKGCFGHEIAGTVVEVGRQVGRGWLGERVFIRTPRTTGYAEYAAAREIALGRLPAAIPFEQGAILQLLPLAINATRGVRLGDRVLIVGQGPVGLMALQVARMRGASHIIVADLDDWRLKRSAALGADHTIKAPAVNLAAWSEVVAEIDVAIDAVGTPSTLNSCVNLVRHHGLVVMLGTHHVDTRVTVDLVQWEHKGLRVHSSAEATDEDRRAAMRQAQRLVDAGRIRLPDMLTHVMPLEDLPKAIAKLSESSVLDPEKGPARYPGPPPETLKVAICP
jgi:2-desacetyl-2-hydroxyethyl bacteriochlorophyllide A dehydrogenase